MQVFIQPLSSGYYALLRTLEKFRPLFIMLYNPDMSVIRYLEGHKSAHPGMPMKVYFMFYKDSTEEQRYLQSVKRETEAFKFLAKEHSVIKRILPL